MTDKKTASTASESNTQKNPDDWVTGDEEMTGAQRSYLKTLSEEAKEPFDDTLTKAQASIRIDELQHITGRGEKSTAPTGEKAAKSGKKPSDDAAQSDAEADADTDTDTDTLRTRR